MEDYKKQYKVRKQVEKDLMTKYFSKNNSFYREI